ncbi:YidC/Oxa1 family membrane protein insertase [Raoultibacter phocaeensis]|uniref:YidC/Oxa1 family membrane protein insertase n=1 Tax=Raoultibacter phocaeensis TaxID=2479841 RepID=UPI0011183F31|nr:YidC/Oxa1 family membrane protein insertase [Raoultibacter phocaeensis]
MEWLAQALNVIMQPCYQLTGNWWIAILLFTVIVKIILLPLSLWCQKNAIVMVQLIPAINRIKVKYFGDREAIGDKQHEMFKEKHYHPLLSLVPLAVQILILFGLVDVIHGITDYGAPGTELLGMVPATDGGISWFMPLAAGLSAIVMGFAQNRINPLQREQSRAEKNMTNGLSIGLSFILGIFVATGMGFYWVCSNLMSVAIQAICNVIIKPKKYIDYADLEASRTELEELEALDANDRKWYQRNPLGKREKADYKRFFNVVNKHLVFYSESSGFYKYFQGTIEWLLENSDMTIHYITNDPDDQIFGIAKREERIQPYYIGPKRIITLMMKMDAQMVAATLEDFDNYYIKRSYVCDDTEYVFFFHHMTSTHMTPNKGAFDGYDTVMCVGQHQVDELRRAEELYKTPAKTLVPYGYDLLDRTIESYRALVASGAEAQNERPTVIVAPSWQEGCILDSCIDEVIGGLRGRGYRVIVRPHPEYVKRYRPRWEAILARYGDAPDDELYFEGDFSSNVSVFTSDVLITDWSTVAHEFSFSTNKPSIFIDTPMKVCNPDYEELGIVPTDISLRNEIGVSLPLDGLEQLPDTVAEMLANPEAWHDRIAAATKQSVFNLGHSAEVAGEFILTRLLEKQAAKKGATPPSDPGKKRSSDAAERRPEKKRGRELAKAAASHLPEAALATLVALPFMAEPAYAYVDPSVMTYTIQALAGVAVALSAVLGVVFRKTRRKLFAMFKIDENAHKVVEGDIHRVVDGRRVDENGAYVALDQDYRFGKSSQTVRERRRASTAQDGPRWRARFGQALLACAFLFYSLFVVAPFEIVASNSGSLILGLQDVGSYMIAFAAILALGCALLASALHGRAFTIALVTIVSVGTCCYLQAMFMNQGLPTADGSTVPWQDFSTVSFATAAIWLALIVGAIIASRRNSKLWRTIAGTVAIILIVVQTVGIASLFTASNISFVPRQDQIECTEDGLFELSPENNVVVFVLDTYDTIDLQNVFDTNPDLMRPFENFTFFENSTGSMIPTRYAVPFLLTDVTPRPGETYEQYYSDRYGQGTFLSDVYDTGYSIGLYSDSLGVDYTMPSEQKLASQTINLHPIENKQIDVRGTIEILAQSALYRDMPWLLKPQFWFYTDEMNDKMTFVSNEGEDSNVIYRMNDGAYHQKLKSKKLSLEDDGKAGAFRFIHLAGAHPPYVLDENGNNVGKSSSSFKQQAIGSLAIVNEYLEQMKELGVYDSSTIIVTADHGYWYITPDMVWDTTSPIMLVKPANETGERKPLAVSDMPVSHMDFQPTVLDAMGADSEKYGDTIFEIDDPNRKRLYYMTTSNGKHDTGIREIEIDGDALDFNTWKLTGNDWPIIPPQD